VCVDDHGSNVILSRCLDGANESGLRRERRRALDDPALDLSVTVRADQDALLDLFSVSGDRLSTRNTDCERLRGRIDVMEMQIDDAPVVAANSAAASGFMD
jgi:hypothetical protein